MADTDLILSETEFAALLKTTDLADITVSNQDVGDLYNLMFGQIPPELIEMNGVLQDTLLRALKGPPDPRALAKTAEVATRQTKKIWGDLARSELNKIGQTIQAGIADGLGPREVARLLDAVKGLDPQRAARFTKFQKYLASKGFSDEEIARRSEREFLRLLRQRRNTISTTEMRFATEHGNAIAAESQKANWKTWITAQDDRVSEDDCEPNQAQGWISVKEAFSSGDETPPAHPGCRCNLAYRTAPPSPAAKARADRRADRTTAAKQTDKIQKEPKKAKPAGPDIKSLQDELKELEILARKARTKSGILDKTATAKKADVLVAKNELKAANKKLRDAQKELKELTGGVPVPPIAKPIPKPAPAPKPVPTPAPKPPPVPKPAPKPKAKAKPKDKDKAFKAAQQGPPPPERSAAQKLADLKAEDKTAKEQLKALEAATRKKQTEFNILGVTSKTSKEELRRAKKELAALKKEVKAAKIEVKAVNERIKRQDFLVELDKPFGQIDKDAISDYTKDLFFKVNQELNAGRTGAVRAFTDKLDAALEKLPPAPGKTIRRLTFFDDADLEKFLARHQTGAPVRYDAYTSATKLSETKFPAAGRERDVLLRINGKSGRDISSFSLTPQEEEILFGRNTQFIVDSVVEGVDGGPTIITLTEV